MNCPDVTLRCMNSHLYHVVFISTCNVLKIIFMFVFIIVLHTQSIFTVYTYPVRLLHVTLNINQSHSMLLLSSPRFGSVVTFCLVFVCLLTP